MLLMGATAAKAAPAKTLVQDVLYRADGSAAQGTITIRWNRFTTSDGEAVPAGELTANTDANGGISIPLIANRDATPTGSYYRVVMKLDGIESEDAWVVPAAASTTLAAISAKVVPPNVAAVFVDKEYVDGEIDGLATVASTGSFNDLKDKPPAVNLAAPGAIGTAAPAPVAATAVTAQNYAYGAMGTQYLVTEGDSETAGYLLSSPATQSWPYRLSQQAYFKNRATLVNAAVSGSTCASMTSRYATAVQPYKPNGTTITKAYLAVMIGRNDSAGLAASAIESCIDSYITQANSDGFTTVLMTVMPASVLPLGPVGTAMNVTAVAQAYTSGPNGYVTITAPNSFTGSGSEYVYLTGFTGAASYLNNNILPVLAAGLSGTQFEALTGVETPFATLAQSGAAFAQTAYSSWDWLTPAQDAVRQQVNSYILQDNDATLAKTPAMVVDAASLISNPNDPATTFDGTHFKPYVYAALAETIGAKFNMSGGARGAQPLNSNYNPIFQGEMTAGEVTATMPNNASVGSSASNAYIRTYGNSGAAEFFTDAYNPNTLAFMPWVVRASQFQLSDSGNQNLVVDSNGTTGLKGLRSVSVFAGPVGSGGGATNPTSGTWATLSGNSPATLRSYNYTAGADDVLFNRGTTIHFIVNNGTDIGNFSAAGLSTTGVSATGSVAAGTSVSARDSITKNTPLVDIRSYGAKCDGVTDDTAALQSAITAVSGGGKIGSFGYCYFANPAGLTWGNSGVIEVVGQGQWIVGSTLVVGSHVHIVGDGGAPGVMQFLPIGPFFSISGKTTGPTLGTLGTTFAAGTATFTPSSMNGIVPGEAISVAGMQSCAITKISRAGSRVTATLSGSCRTPAGVNATIAGVTDNSYNGTFVVTNSDYGRNTISWWQALGDGSSSGGTLTALNEDSIETVSITATTSTTATATFLRPHNSTDMFGGVVVELAGLQDHSMTNVDVGGCYGSCIWLNDTAFAGLVNVGAQAGGIYTSSPLELTSSWWVTIEKCAFNPNFSTSQPWGIHMDENDPNPNNSTGSLDISDTTIGGGVKIDTTGTNRGHIAAGVTFHHIVVEQPITAAVVIDPRYAASIDAVYMDDLGQQDNFAYYLPSVIYYTDYSGGKGGIDLKESDNGGGGPLVGGGYFDGSLLVRGSVATLPATGISPVGTWTDGKTTETELRGEGAGMSPQLIPFPTQPIVDPTLWSSVSNGCTVTQGIPAPDGSTTAVGLLSSNGGGANEAYQYHMTTNTGDWFLYGAWVKPGSGVGYSSGLTGNPFHLHSYGPNDVFAGAVAASNEASPSPFQTQFQGDWWTPVVAIAQLKAGDGGNHPYGFEVGCSTTPMDMWGPFMIQVPASAGVSVQEVERWRQQLLHGYVPPSMPGGGQILAMHPGHKLYWGNDTNLYRGAAGVVQTDGSINIAAGKSYQVGGSAITTGTLADWSNSGLANGYVPTWNGTKYVPAPPSGGVTGPSSSAVNSIATFNSTTGAAIKDSGVAVSSLSVAPVVLDFKTTTAPTGATGGNPWTYTLPATAHMLTVYVMSGGSGGGSGGVAATGGNIYGGGGGTGGNEQYFTVPASYFGGAGATITVTVGAGGNGGAAVSGSGTAVTGNTGVAGGVSYILGSNGVQVYAGAGVGGSGGSTSSASGGNIQNFYTLPGSSGAAGSLTTGTGIQPLTNPSGAGGGAGGGGITSGTAYGGGGQNGGSATIPGFRTGCCSANVTGGTAPGGAGQTPTFSTSEVMIFGQIGGTGGASGITINGGAGGAGMFPGGGGAGGGAAASGHSSGAGGNGGDGIVRIIVQ
jgi:hypothetical protein